MKQKKYFFLCFDRNKVFFSSKKSKKFHKKYVFLQNSLFDFVYWRSQKSIQQRKKNFMNTNFGSNFENLIFHSQQSLFLEQEKTSFQEYWQSSEFQKIKTEIQNRNKEFQNLDISSTLANEKFLLQNSNKKMNVLKCDKYNLKNENVNSFSQEKENLKSMQYQKPIFPYIQKKQIQKTKFQMYLSSSFVSNETKSFFLRNKTRKNKFVRTNFRIFSSYSETFIPKSDCFRRMEKFHFLNFQKVGQFFPKSKNFQQYWIFPLLGFVLFFPISASFEFSTFSNCFRQFSISPFCEPIRMDNQIQPVNKENLENPLAKNSFFQNQSKNKDFYFNNSYDFLTPNFFATFFPLFQSKQSLFFEEKKQNKMYLEKNFIPFFKKKIQNQSFQFLQNQTEFSGVNFSYTNQKSLENGFSLQKLETTEFEKFSNFYFEKFNKVCVSVFMDGKKNEFGPNFLFPLAFPKSKPSVLTKNFEKQFFKKSIESKRNVFNWQWFTVQTTPFLQFQNNRNFQNFDRIIDSKNNSFFLVQNHMQKNIFNLCQSSQFKIPQKAQFFMNNVFDQNLYLFPTYKNLTFQFSPIFHFVNSASIFQEFEKNLFFSPNFFSFVSNETKPCASHKSKTLVLPFFLQKKTQFLKFEPVQTFDSSNEFQDLGMYQNFRKKMTSIESLLFKSHLNFTNNQIQKFFRSTRLRANQNFEFFQNSKKEKKIFFNSSNIFEKKNSFHNLFLFFNNSISDEKILQKWFQTQHLLRVQHTQKNFMYPNKNFAGLSENQQNLQFVATHKKLKNYQTSQKILQIFTDLQQKLDTVYFQKMCQPFTCKFSLISSFEKNFSHFEEQKFIGKPKVLNFGEPWREEKGKFFSLLSLTNQKKVFFKKKLYQIYLRKYWNKEWKKMFFKRFQFFLFPQKNAFSLSKIPSNFPKSSFLVLNQLPLFLDFGIDFPKNFSSQSYAFSNFSNGDECFDFAYLNSQKHKQKNEDARIDSKYLTKSFFQTFLFNFQNSHLFFNNFEFFTNDMTSKSFHLGKYLGNIHDKNFRQFQNSKFVRSKLNVFEKVLRKLKSHSLLNMSCLNMFKTTFFFEKMKKPQACTFQISKDFRNFYYFEKLFGYISNQMQDNKKTALFSNFEEFKFQNSRFPLVLQKSKPSVLQKIFEKQNRSLKIQYQYSPYFFCQKQSSLLSQNFSLRKFEKVFQKSFSCFQQTQIKKSSFFPKSKSSFFSSFGTNFNDVSFSKKSIKNIDEFESLFSQNNSFFSIQSKKDKRILKSLSTSFQNLYNSSQSSILLFSNKNKNQKIQTSFNFLPNLSSFQPNEHFFSTGKINKTVSFQNNKEYQNNRNFRTPHILLKRDGFLFYPSNQKFFSQNRHSQILKILEYSGKQNLVIGTSQNFWFCQNKSFSNVFEKQKKILFSNFQEISPLFFSKQSLFFEEKKQKQKNLFQQRLEKEKHLQKKRRLKKQKFETRRRKKRKRFFPRPVWLRFHLYKKFLNIRHSKKSVDKKFMWKSSNFDSFAKNSFFGFGPNQNLEFFRCFDRNKVFFSKKKSKNKKKQKDFFMLNSLKIQKNRIQKNIFLPKHTYFNVHSFFMPFSKISMVQKYKKIRKNSFLFSKYKKNIFSDSQIVSKNIFEMSKWKFFTKNYSYESLTNKLYEKNIQKWGFSGPPFFSFWRTPRKSKPLIVEKQAFLKKFFKNSCFLEFPNQSLLKRNSKNCISKNIEDYKISGEILSEFARLSWKSYWFQTNFKPFQRKIFKNFRKMKEIEGKKNFDQYTFFDFLGNQQFSWFNNIQLFRSFFLSQDQFPFLKGPKNKNFEMISSNFFNFNFLNSRFEIFPFQEFDMFFSNNQPFQNISFWNMDFQKNFLLRKLMFQKFSWYFNIQNSLHSNSLQNDCSLFQQVQNIPEYNRILYSRVSKIFKNFKSLETNEEFFLKNVLSKIPKRKNENMSISNTNLSFFTKSALFSENFCIPTQPFIPAFSLFSSLFQDSSIKPTGELPTLRALWAFHQTNLFHFQEKNAIRNVWTFKKRTDSLKNLKGTKKIFSFFRKFKNTEKIQSLLSNDVFVSLANKKSTKTLNSFLASNVVFYSKSEFRNFLNTLENMCFGKFQNAEKKSSLFGFKSLQQNSKLSLRYLKFHLVSKWKSSVKHSSFSKSEVFTNTKHKENSQTPNTQFEKDFPRKIGTYFSYFPEKKSNPLNSAKSSFNYWWAQRNFQIFPFFLSSSNSSNFFVDFEFNFFNPFIFQNFGSLNSQKIMQNSSFFQNFEIGKFQFICLGAILFHFAIFMTLLKISEIRSIFKFQCLIFYKIFNSFSILLFSMHDFLKKYIDQIVQTCQFYFSFHQKKKKIHFGKFSRQKLKILPSSSYFDENTNKYIPMHKNFVENFHKKSSNSNFHKNFLFEFFIRISTFSMIPNASIFYGKKNCLPTVFLVSDEFPNLKLRNQIFNFQIQKSQNFPWFSYKSKLSIFQKKQNLVFFENKQTNFPVFRKIANQKFANKDLEKNKTLYVMNQMYFSKKSKENFNFFVFCSTSLNFSKKIFNTFKKQYSFLHLNKTIFDICEKDFKNLFLQETRFLPLFLTKQSLFFEEKKQEKYISNLVDSKSFNHFFSPVFFPWSKSMFKSSGLSLFFSKQSLGRSSSQNLQFSLFFGEKKEKDIGSKNFKIQKTSQHSFNSFHNIASNSEKFFSEFALSLLIIGKSFTLISFNFFKCGSNLSKFFLNILEFFMLNIYKFLEKPAEFMIEWIALIFLIEWSSDPITFIPDTLDISVWKSSQKFLRPFRGGSLVFSFFNSSMSGSVVSSSVNFMDSINRFSYSNMISFIVFKRFFYFFENFGYQLTLPDIDIFIRQKKGMIFWDIWSEILFKAAEKYNVNIPSFVTLKEEQELFIEKLLQDEEFFKSVSIGNSFSRLEKKIVNSKNQKVENIDLERIRQNSLTSSIQNFLIQEKPEKLSPNSFDFLLNTNAQTKIVENFMFPDAQSFPSKMSYFPLFNLWFNKVKLNGDTQNTLCMNKNILDFVQNIPMQKIDSSIVSNTSVFQFSKNIDRRACNQYSTYQSPETDLFIDLHPSKSFQHIHYFKYYESAQYTLGSFICQVYAGIFSKKVSKNILLIGSPGTAKTLLIQALAGETEMKIITDNAHRYSTVLRGVAVGMKYLRDVFDAIALQTPCFFLMEHIHVIGSKRPFLISENENGKGIYTSFGLDQQEVHETNQMIYQSNKHSISDSKRPYKGDFSMGIATNFFVQNFYSKIEKNSFSIFQNSQFSFGGTSSTSRHSPTYPFPIDSIEHSINQQNFAQKENSDSNFLKTPSSNVFNQNFSFENRNFQFQSFLQLSKQQVFAPPATSPFAVLMMKEQKKFQPKKIVQENSWGGITTDQLLSYQKESLSIRAKVAILADMTMNLSRGKFDMITDLLVILDSVRSNRGFVVFATTHIPSSLDPALRRPGRFDETISLAQNTNFFNRFEILKIEFSNSISTLDFFDSSIMTENFSEIDLMNLIIGTKLSFFHQYKFTKNFNFPSHQTTIFSQISPQKAFQSFLKSLFFHNFYQKHPIFQYFETNKSLHSSKYDKNSISFSQNFSNLHPQTQTNMTKFFPNNFKNNSFQNSLISESSKQNFSKQFQFSLRNPHLSSYTMLPKGPSHVLSFAYSKVGQLIIQLNICKDPTCFAPVRLDISKSSNIQELIGNSLSNSQEQQKLQFMFFLSGKISEFFGTNGWNTYSFEFRSNFQNCQNTNFGFLKDSIQFFDRKFLKFHSILSKDSNYSWLQTKLGKLQQTSQEKTKFSPFDSKIEKVQSVSFNKEYKMSIQRFSFLKNSYFSSVFGNDDSIHSTTTFLFSIVQKRFLFTKNLLLSKMLFFDNRTSRKQPPSPPISSILMPSKKYENLKRTENDFHHKARFSINEKIQFHQQQRFLKQLYNIPVQQYFRSEIVQKRHTLFGNSFQEIAYLDSFTNRSSSIHFYQRKYIGFRHRFSNINQWWTGFLPEHTPESTYLSDVDWRTMFLSKNDQINVLRNKILFDSNSNENFQFFPLFFSKQSLFFKEKKQKNKKFPWLQSNSKSLDLHEQQNLQSIYNTLEYTMDFPDSEHYYNPRNRRWYFNKHSLKTSMENSSYWLNFDTNLQYEIHYHFFIESFQKTYEYFDTNREMLDFYVFSLLKTGFLKELDCLTTSSRFQNFFFEFLF